MVVWDSEKKDDKRATSMDLRGFDLNLWSNSMKIVKFESSFGSLGEFLGGKCEREIPRMTPQELFVEPEGEHKKVVQV